MSGDQSSSMQRCTTTRNEAPFHFQWTIEKFSALQDDEERTTIRSSMFNICHEVPGRVNMILYTKGPELSIYIKYNSNSQEDFKIKMAWSISIQSSSKPDYTLTERGRTFTKESDNWGWRDFIPTKVLFDRRDDLLTNDTMVLICQGRVDLGVKTVCETTVQVDPPNLVGDLNNLLKSKEDVDLTLISEGRHIQVHKLVLMARSPVFASMFRHDMQEKHSGIINITDVRPDVLEAMVAFIYTDQEPPEMTQVAEELLIAADKYDLPRLKSMCESHLCIALKLTNLLHMLTLAANHNAPQLKKVCLQRAALKLDKIMTTSAWKEAKSLPHDLLVELLELNRAPAPKRPRK